MKEYPFYVDARLPWVQLIPRHWKLLRNKAFLLERAEISTTGDETLLSLSQYTGVSIKDKDREKNGMYEAKSLIGYKTVFIDDIVMNIMLAWNGSTARSKYKGIISPAYAIYKVVDDIVNPDYLHYIFKTPQYMRYFEAFSTGIIKSRLRLYPQTFLHLYTIIPPRPEQDQIVRFLDWKVSSINRLINIKQKEIVTLEELKQNIITNCITMGLNRNVEMKYSGNEWISYIPWHWTTVQLRRVYTVILGKMLSPAPINNQDSYEEYVCAKDVHFDGVDLSSLKKMWFSQMEKKQYEIRKGDLLIVEGGAGAGNAAIVYDLYGKSIYVQNSIHIVRSKSNRVINKFLCYWISSLVKRGYMKNVCSVATIPHYTKDKVLSTMMPLPPIEEQTDIVDYLDMKCEVIDNIIAKKHKQIQQLQELKAQLTSDAVTGKIDVRDIEVPAFEYVEETVDSSEEDDRDMGNVSEDEEE